VPVNGLFCDRCGRGLLTDQDVRYVVRIDVTAAYDPLEITAEELARDHTEEIRALLTQLQHMSEQEIMDQVHRSMTFDLCATCHGPYLESPLGEVREGNV
jgi:hypothetical protein